MHLFYYSIYYNIIIYASELLFFLYKNNLLLFHYFYLKVIKKNLKKNKYFLKTVKNSKISKKFLFNFLNIFITSTNLHGIT
jgi:hypothetical protein